MPEWKGRVPLTRSHCERITADFRTISPGPRPRTKELLEKRIKQLESELEEERRRTQRERMAVVKLQNKLIKITSFASYQEKSHKYRKISQVRAEPALRLLYFARDKDGASVETRNDGEGVCEKTCISQLQHRYNKHITFDRPKRGLRARGYDIPPPLFSGSARAESPAAISHMSIRVHNIKFIANR
ncbi:hypothetical protein EVAR_11223_1 [Eumeta japonica]|uniref:Uncharacterized protein n=1 Tax=Eumeta variegata TaxID=151549 RepID=A0A4C1ZZ12_EUMVA|nr:hypothetical protein EVAR_11223_1 [Eumeta japonica]